MAGPYATFDDMPYSDKKKAYLAIAPVINLYLDDKTTYSTSSIRQVNTTKGTITIGGEMTINLYEPMTKERIMSKRINLSDFNISRSYIKQSERKFSTSYGNVLFDGIVYVACLPFKARNLTDNSDKALTEALNEFYAKAMPKIDKMVTNEELANYEKAVAELKGLKRY